MSIFPRMPLRKTTKDSLLTSLFTCRFEESDTRFGEHRQHDRLDVIEAALDKIGLWSQLCLPLRKREPDDELPHVTQIDGESYIRIGRRLNELNTLRAAQQIDWTRPPTVMDEMAGPRALSSGEYAMLRFASQAVAAIEEGSLLLLDEPETHLHPNFISDLIEVLYQLLKATKSIAIIATHSTYVVREVSREGVKILSVEDGFLSVDTPRLQTFGSNIDTISQFVFGDTNVDHHFQHVLTDWARGVAPTIGLEGIVKEYGKSLNAESLSLIARFLDLDQEAD